MNKILYKLLILIAASSLNFGQDQNYNYYNFNQSLGIQFNAGYNSFNLTKAEKYFKETVDFYRDKNLPMEVQTLYPSNIIIGGGFYYFPVRSLSITLSAEFTKSKAYSLYGDNSGTIDLKSEVDFFSFYFGVQKHFTDLFIIQPYLGIDLGAARGEYSHNNKVLFNDFPQYNQNNEVSFSSYGFKTEAYLGASYNLDVVVLSLQGGYRFSIVSKPDKGDIYWENLSHNFPFDLEATGLVIKMIIRMGMFW